MQHCPRCQALVSQQSQFCMYCGQPFEDSAEGLSIAALVCGILSAVMLWSGTGVFVGIPGIILARMAEKRAVNPKNAQRARTALVCSIIGIIGSVVAVLLFIGLLWLICKAMVDGMPR